MSTGGDGQVLIQDGLAKSGAFAAQLTETSNRNSFAYIKKTFSTSPTDVWLSGDFIVTADGGSGSTVPIIKLIDTGGIEQAFIYRRGQNGGKIVLSAGGSTIQTSGNLPLNTWGHFELHLITAGSGLSTIELYLDGVVIYQTSTGNLGTIGLTTVQIGDENVKQAFSLVADNILVETK